MRLQTASKAITYGTLQIFSAFAVVAPAATNTLGIVGNHNSGSSNSGPQFLRVDDWDVQAVRVKQSVVNDGAGVTIPADTWGIAAGRMTTTTLESFWGGVGDGATSMSTTNTTPSGNNTKLAIGDVTTFTNSGFDGPIAEVVVFAEDLTDSEMNDVGNYLASKWAVSWSDI